ncbi:putative O-antigen transporter [mine drainage metagenome]|uniref:Putative O-antigen transporter n=1 Tax=mine drainage metagenome TaxID=410659 RepID=A0A1J5SGK8_9ZZZZ
MKKNYLYNLSLSIVNILFPILSFPYASRILGPSGIGKVQMVSSFAQYFALIAALGIPIYGIQEIAKARHDKKKLSVVFSELLSIYFIASLLVSSFYIIIIFFFPFFQSNLQLYYTAIILVLFGFSSIDWLYSGLEEFRIIAIRSIAIKILALVCLYLFVKTSNDYLVYLCIIIFSLMGNNIISLLMLGSRTSLVLHHLNLKQHIKPLFYIFSTTMAASMYTILDTVLLGFLSNENAVGLYTAAIKLCKIALPFVTSIGIVLIPKLSQSVAENNFEEMQNLLDKSFHFISFFSVPVMMGLLVLAPEFIAVFSGSKFHEAITSMQILSVLPLLIGFGYFFAFQILVPLGKNREMFLSVVGGMCAGFLLNFLLVPALKDKGAAIANAVSEIIVTILYFYFVQKHHSFKYKWVLLFKAFVCALPFIPIVLLIRSFETNAIITLMSSIIFCAAIYFTVQYFIFKDHFILKILDPYLIRIGIKKIKEK